MRATASIVMAAALLAASGVPGWANRVAPGHTVDSLRRDWRSLVGRFESDDRYTDYPHLSCFRQASAQHDLPLPLLLGLAWGESDFDASARSSKDAYGLMQIRWPLTARSLGFRSIDELKDPCRNVEAGARYLRQLLDRVDDDLVLALASYNHGPTAIGGRDANVNRHARWYVRYIHDRTATVVDRRQWASGRRALRLGRFSDYGMATTALRRYERRAAHQDGVSLDLRVQRLSDGRFELRVDCRTVEAVAAERRRYERLTGFVPR